MESAMRHRLVSLVGIATVTAILLTAPYAAAIWKIGAIVGGKTEVTASATCNANVWTITRPVVLGVSVGDTFTVWHNATWWDNRSGFALPTAYHTFTLDVNYDSTTTSASYTVPTSGIVSGTHTYTLNATMTVSHLSRQVHINWSASVYISTPGGCSASMSDHIWFWTT